MSFDLDVSELLDLAKELAKASDRKKAEATRVVQRAGAGVQQRARAAAPRDRPWLSTAGIRRKTWKPTDGVHVDVFTAPDPSAKGDDSKRNVGFYVEHGTSDMPPRPFLGPQVPTAEAQLVKELGEVLNPFDDRPIAEVPDD